MTMPYYIQQAHERLIQHLPVRTVPARKLTVERVPGAARQDKRGPHGELRLRIDGKSFDTLGAAKRHFRVGSAKIMQWLRDGKAERL